MTVLFTRPLRNSDLPVSDASVGHVEVPPHDGSWHDSEYLATVGLNIDVAFCARREDVSYCGDSPD
jgi:hypothetical protein